MATRPLKVFIGWDPREEEAYEVARFSLLRHASIALCVEPLIQSRQRAQGAYSRPVDPRASTEFTYTRFLTPYLCGFEGLALYFDCDFLWRDDVAKLLAERAPEKAVHCVHHDYRPKETSKMDGRVQEAYPRKNWSSLMLFECERAACRLLTPERINSAEPQYLHRMAWADDSQIGALSPKWNWLEGWCSAERGDPEPAAVHFTRGGPWFENWTNVDYADEWRLERSLMTQERSDCAIS